METVSTVLFSSVHTRMRKNCGKNTILYCLYTVHTNIVQYLVQKMMPTVLERTERMREREMTTKTGLEVKQQMKRELGGH